MLKAEFVNYTVGVLQEGVTTFYDQTLTVLCTQIKPHESSGQLIKQLISTVEELAEHDLNFRYIFLEDKDNPKVTVLTHSLVTYHRHPKILFTLRIGVNPLTQKIVQDSKTGFVSLQITCDAEVWKMLDLDSYFTV